jgi:hypothetical protein
MCSYTRNKVSVSSSHTAARALETLLEQCDVIDTCEQLAASGEEHASIAARLPFGPEQLPLLLSATESLLVDQAAGYRRCADQLNGVDAILARHLRRLADELDAITVTTLASARREASELAQSDDAAIAA